MNDRIYCDCNEYQDTEAYIQVRVTTQWPDHVFIAAKSHTYQSAIVRLTKKDARLLARQLVEATKAERTKATRVAEVVIPPKDAEKTIFELLEEQYP